MFGDEQIGGMEFADYLAMINNPQMQDKKGRVNIDEQGNRIDPYARRKPQAIKRNPYNINPGNAIDPNTRFADDVLSKGNKSFGSAGLQDKYNQARGM